jgi:demethylmenaquinone methyltransferase/2-methoxy-6-polyprenyl-1,4-benzoquinol methylase
MMKAPTSTPENLTGSQRARYVQGLFERVAPHYDLANGFITGGMHRIWRRATVRTAHALLPESAEGRRIYGLDICCGTGDYVFLLRESLGENACLVGLDFCEPMLRKAVERARAGTKSKAPVWLKGDATNLSVFQNASFDVATVGFGLRNIVDLPAALREAARVLRPGGIFVSLELTRPESGPMRPLIYAYLRWFLPVLARMAQGSRDDYLWLRRSLEAFPAALGLSNLLESSGFQVVEVRKFGFGAVAAHIARRIKA